MKENKLWWLYFIMVCIFGILAIVFKSVIFAVIMGTFAVMCITKNYKY